MEIVKRPLIFLLLSVYVQDEALLFVIMIKTYFMVLLMTRTIKILTMLEHVFNIHSNVVSIINYLLKYFITLVVNPISHCFLISYYDKKSDKITFNRFYVWIEITYLI